MDGVKYIDECGNLGMIIHVDMQSVAVLNPLAVLGREITAEPSKGVTQLMCMFDNLCDLLTATCVTLSLSRRAKNAACQVFYHG